MLRCLCAAMLAPALGQAQHAEPQSLLERAGQGVGMSCRAIDPPNPSLPASVLSFEFRDGTVKPAAGERPMRMTVHRRFTVVWDSAGRLVVFSGVHTRTDTDSLDAGFMVLATGADSLEGRWLLSDHGPRAERMSPSEIQRARDLSALLWSRRCARP